jgi:hypothetical protein
MAKFGLGVLAFLALFAVTVLVGGSIPPQPTTNAGRLKPVGAERGQAIERVIEARRAKDD